MSDLKTVLGQKSDSKFVVWAITSEPCSIFNKRASALQQNESFTWAEVVMQQTMDMRSVLYLVVVAPAYEYSHPVRRVTIYGQPWESGTKQIG